MRNIDWSGVSDPAEYPKPNPGGYIVRILAVQDEEIKEYLKISYDFAEGELKGYYKELNQTFGFWGGTFIKSYKEKALTFFKAFKTAVEESNPPYVFRNDPKSLVGKFVGVVLAEEEYTSNAGQIKTRLYVDQVRSIQAIWAGDFAVPPLKKLAPDKGKAPVSSTDGYADSDPYAGFSDLEGDDKVPF